MLTKIAEFIATLSDDEREEFDERAAILEFDAGFERGRAERGAMKLLDQKRTRGTRCI